MEEQRRPRYQPTDYRVLVITGTEAGVTGGDPIPAGMIGVVKHLAYSDIGNTGPVATVRTQPSGINLDVRNVFSPNFNWPDFWAFSEDTVLGYIGSQNVVQVITAGGTGNVVVRVVYVVEEGRV